MSKSTTIEDFRNHAENEHGIDYTVEAVKQILIRKQKKGLI